ncbi:MAG: hypothetical protein E6K81_16460 [Candidatus Eisenbacteria bacterium]|uniref:Uncharacterized protein n=1 Tax=Eiseniibacteriota bacterium TaxID=2212470 RepID=A0A538TYS9_UNCEI|nr:MAG: hypothetical protein E6K81_16460 [Candidatus Eisenbacteria bacterium]
MSRRSRCASGFDPTGTTEISSSSLRSITGVFAPLTFFVVVFLGRIPTDTADRNPSRTSFDTSAARSCSAKRTPTSMKSAPRSIESTRPSTSSGSPPRIAR